MSANPQRIEEHLRALYLKAEQDLVDAISYKRSKGLIDYAEQAALHRVQRILAGLQDECWRYVPVMVESEFYVHHPAAARLPESVVKHMTGYFNAEALTTEQTAVVQILTSNLMGSIIQAANTAQHSAVAAIGRLNSDEFRRAGLARAAEMEAAGGGTWSSAKQMVAQLRADGLTAFVDKSGKQWGLRTYCSMITRTTTRQAENLAILTRDPKQDLFQISSHGTTCPACAPYEGRVYSKSGKNPDYPPLSAAFGKIDTDSPDSLLNSYLGIHPNCLHTLMPYTTYGLTDAQIQWDKTFSSFRSNPPDRDPRSNAQIEAYRKQQAGRQKYLRLLQEYQKYRIALGDRVPKTAQTFLKHRLANDEKYQNWKSLYDRL